jgi:hypothetical protein
MGKVASTIRQGRFILKHVHNIMLYTHGADDKKDNEKTQEKQRRVRKIKIIVLAVY